MSVVIVGGNECMVTTSHKMVKHALSEVKGRDTKIERCHSSSLSALRGILDKHIEVGSLCTKNC